MKNTPSLLRPLILTALVSLLLTACASEAAKAQAKAQRDAVASGKYVWYTPVGSNIRVLVPADQAKARDKETEQTQEAFRQAQQNGVSQPHGN